MKRVNICFDDQETVLLESLKNKYGGTLPQVVRDAVKFRYDKTFPPYARGKKGSEATAMTPEAELTNEQKCEMNGGKVIIRDGIPTCAIPRSKSLMAYLPLSKPELF